MEAERNCRAKDLRQELKSSRAGQRVLKAMPGKGAYRVGRVEKMEC